MCLGIPMEVVAVDGLQARGSAQGVEREISLFLLKDEQVAAGDFVLVHVGYAIQKMTPQDARSTWELYDELLRAEGAQADA
jgi:hydrogenase expression/formation protein HypC